jgi:hypothetical protein
MAYSLKQAAEAAGKSKPTILRAIQSGRISAARDPNTMAWLIEPAELHRVYPLTDEPLRNTEMTRDVIPSDSAVLQRELDLLREERERERRDAQATIADLRERLDREAEERRQAQAQLAALLTDQRPAPVVRRSWLPWRRQ